MNYEIKCVLAFYFDNYSFVTWKARSHLEFLCSLEFCNESLPVGPPGCLQPCVSSLFTLTSSHRQGAFCTCLGMSESKLSTFRQTVATWLVISALGSIVSMKRSVEAEEVGLGREFQGSSYQM